MADLALNLTAQTRIAERQGLIDQIQQKMRKVVDEFAAGEISREQFHQIYEHYQAQIIMASQMLAVTDGSLAPDIQRNETIAIRKQFMAKAKAMAVYYHSTGLLLETIGDFDVPVNVLAPLLNNLHDQVQRNAVIEPKLIPVGRESLLIVSGKFSTSILMFSNEPAGRQIGFIQGMHRDFETANESALRSGHADSTKLVYPFQSFVRRSVGMK